MNRFDFEPAKLNFSESLWVPVMGYGFIIQSLDDIGWDRVVVVIQNAVKMLPDGLANLYSIRWKGGAKPDACLVTSHGLTPIASGPLPK